MRDTITGLLFVSTLVLMNVSCAAPIKPPPTPPPLKWVKGNISQILSQPKEAFHVVAIYDGATTLVRFCDPYDGTPLELMTSSITYDLLRNSFFAGRSVDVGYRDHGFDPKSGSQKLCIDRISVYS